MDWIQQWQSKLNKQNGVAPLVRTGGSRHTGLAALPHRNIQAVNYARNHKEMLMNYLQDGRCEISNNTAERSVKSYVMARKNFLFHDQADGAAATAIVFSLTETAKANNLNVYQYLYMLLLYMPDYKEKPAGIAQLLPWSDFIKERCSGVTDTETIRPENREDLPV